MTALSYPAEGKKEVKMWEKISHQILLASGLPDLQMTGLAEVHLSWINGLER
jgi:hypothetical protein